MRNDPAKVQAVSRTADVWLCFALRREARWVRVPGALRLVTGMGWANTERALAWALARARPRLVLSCGFAGGLNPQWAAGAVLFDASETPALAARLAAAGARKARFCSVDHVVVTAAEKRALYQATGADAVEVESHAVRAFCRARGFPSAIVRAISDPADTDLPADFNRFMTARHRLNYLRLLAWLAMAPRQLAGVLRLRRQCRMAARNLGQVLTQALAGDWL